ncbi:hypothetical protein SLS60_011303 [Paraconiothyrium brasiliense]|uniref:Uncharacterized protein n=1 Tax=Paraconiothyrium brasiliense TaxID=300254 RepID=A0ABR3QJ90_9PLEO
MSWLPDEVDYGYSSVDEADLERRSCGLHPKTSPPQPLPVVTELKASGVKMFRDAIALASSTLEWRKGVQEGQFAFTDWDFLAKAKGLSFNCPREVLNHCLDRIEQNTHPHFDTLSWNVDPFFKKIKIDHVTTRNNLTRVSLPAIVLIQPLADLRAHPSGVWTDLSAEEAQFRSQLWRSMVTRSSYICHTNVLLFILLCAPKTKFVRLAESVFVFDNDNWYDTVVEDVLGSYAEMHEQDTWKVREIFEEVTALLHGQDKEVELEY